MAFTNNPYCLYTDVKMAYPIDSTDTTQDAWIQSLIPQAQALIDREIGYSFQTDGTVPSPATRLYNGTQRDTIMIDDCTSFSQVLEYTYNLIFGQNGYWTSSAPTIVDITADCVLGPTARTYGPWYQLTRLSGSPFVYGKQNYKVFGVFGQPSIPAPISYACVRLVIHFMKKRDTNYADWLYSNNNLKQRFEKRIPEDVQEILSAYKRKVFLSRP